MSVEFNKTRLLNNISFMLKEFGKKIGELENEAGVSPGYLSRTAKDASAKPGIDFIIKAAEALNVSVDTLLNTELTELSPTELYLISFFDKLKRDTITGKLEWTIERADALNNMPVNDENTTEPWVSHPMFSYETFYEGTSCEYPEQVSRPVFKSQAFDVHTYIVGNCYNLRLKDHHYLYLMDFCKATNRVADEVYRKEVWMYNQLSGRQFICDNAQSSPLKNHVEELFEILADYSKHPQIKKDVKSIIDAFMNDDFADTPTILEEDDLPF